MNTKSYDDMVFIYQTAIDDAEGVEMKGKKNRYTSMNGNMFSFLSPEGLLAFRLSSDECKAHNDAHGTAPVMQYNSIMRDYVEVPAAMLDSPVQIAELFAKCVENAKTLKPKPTKKS